ncbi:MAG: hypothetical protein ACI4IH_02945 [Eubacterium sp.]
MGRFLIIICVAALVIIGWRTMKRLDISLSENPIREDDYVEVEENGENNQQNQQAQVEIQSKNDANRK